MNLKDLIENHRQTRKPGDKAYNEILTLIAERTALFNIGLPSDESHVTNIRLETTVEFEDLDANEELQDWVLEFGGMNLIKDVDSSLIRHLLPAPQKIFYKEYLNEDKGTLDFESIKNTSGIEAETMLIPWNTTAQPHSSKTLAKSFALRDNEILGVNGLRGAVLYKIELTLNEVAGQFKMNIALKLNLDHIKQNGSFLIAREAKKRSDSITP